MTNDGDNYIGVFLNICRTAYCTIFTYSWTF